MSANIEVLPIASDHRLYFIALFIAGIKPIVGGRITAKANPAILYPRLGFIFSMPEAFESLFIDRIGYG